jgi:hypothetical protein
MDETKRLYKIIQAVLENCQGAINERLNNSNNALQLEELNKLKVDILKAKSNVEELIKKG